jgi:uncharacterized protein DUF3568
MHQLKRALATVAVLATAGSLSGCLIAVAAAGTGAYLYATSDHEGLIKMTYKEAKKEIPKAMEANGIIVSDWTDGEAKGVVRGVYETDTDVRVEYSVETEKTTRVNIRVGNFGNSELELAIFTTLQEAAK